MILFCLKNKVYRHERPLKFNTFCYCSRNVVSKSVQSSLLAASAVTFNSRKTISADLTDYIRDDKRLDCSQYVCYLWLVQCSSFTLTRFEASILLEMLFLFD
jgi:hypothetical protein